MRTKHLLLFFAVLVTGSFTALNTVTSDGDQDFASSRNAADKIKSVIPLGAEKSFEFDPLQLTDIRNDLVTALDGQTAGNLNWLQKGPINVGGRTRALLMDRDNPNILYAGSVAGGIYKSETNGQYWMPVETRFDASVQSVTSLAQSEDGTIYYTTGDIFDSLLVTKQGISSFAGAGLFKMSPNNDYFEHVTSTDPTANDAFYGVTNIAIVSNTQIYLSTWKGLYFTNDAGSSWSLVSSVPEEYITDVKVNSDGVVITATQGEVYRGSAGGSLSMISGTQEGNIEAGGRRYEFSFAPSDPNFVYAIAATHNDTLIDGSDTTIIRGGKLMGVYRSPDAGLTWTRIAVGGSDEFQLLTRSHPDPNNSQGDDIQDPQRGIGSMMIQVDDEDPNYVYVGGVDLWAGYKPAGVDQFQWIRKTYNDYSKHSPLYLTANIHVMIQHPDNDKAYIGCDGGVYRFEEGYGTVALNNYYSSGLFYDVSYGPVGEYLAGSQDNGTYYNDFSGPGSQTLFAREIIKPEDYAYGLENGFNTYISQLSPRVLFYNHGDKNFRRSLDYGETMNPFYSKLMNKQISGWDLTWNYSYDLWETANYELTYDIREQKFYDTVPATSENPVTLTLQSQNIFGAPVEYVVTDTIWPDSILPFHDPYKAFYAIGLEGNIWLTTRATSNELIDSLDWVPPFVARKYYDTLADPSTVQVNNVRFSEDGNNLYFTLTSFLANDKIKTEIFRMDSLQILNDTGMYEPSAGRIYPVEEIRDYVQNLGTLYNSEVTSIVLSPNTPGRLIITAADYDYTDKVYYCANANTSTSNDFNTNFKSIQGDLPRIPVFDGCINVEQDNQLFLGTEIGVWSTDNYTDASPTWSYNSNSQIGFMGPVPVMAIKQQINSPSEFPLVNNYGVLYAATWGKGIFVDSTYYVENVKEVDADDVNDPINTNGGVSIDVYPNPIKESFNVKFNLAQDGSASLRVFDLSGKVLVQENMGTYQAGSHLYEVNSSDFEAGIYLVEVISGQEKDAMRIIKR